MNFKTAQKIFTGLIILISVTIGFGQSGQIGLFRDSSDVGQVKRKGKARFDRVTGEYLIEGSGSNMWGTNDEFHFVRKEIKGDFILTARVGFKGVGGDPHRKIGLILRNDLQTDSVQAGAVVHGNGLTSLQFRRVKGMETEEIKTDIEAADVLRLERKGRRIIMSAARFGEPLRTFQIKEMSFNESVYAGLFVCSHDPESSVKAVFSDVRLTIPAADDFVPYRDYIGSNLEILNVETGNRRIVYTVGDSLQAPNWTPDGKYLIYNRNGRLYRFGLKSKKSEALNTDFAVNNNNDHVLSYDGKWLGISNHSAEDGNQSVIYVLPSGGGKPRRITDASPSYLHGWSPDGKWLIYTGGRTGNYDIYKISVNGGDEIRLTSSEGLDDGSEYSPDGKYIYFNSTRSGLMQIWRMKPDGSGQEQVTDDDFNNWFPHISPDGDRIMMISYLKDDVKPDDHPFYKRVSLRLMPVSCGKPKIVAYLYGGQGTINVPSWSPDGKYVAFVSNTKVD